MTWGIDEEVSQFTFWFCTYCQDVVAWEDESKGRDCTECDCEKGQIFVWNRDEAFWFCLSCREAVPHDGPKPEWIEMC